MLAVPLSRILWLATVAAALLTAFLLLLSDYTGYAALAVAPIARRRPRWFIICPQNCR